jgi:hypothetical protein
LSYAATPESRFLPLRAAPRPAASLVIDGPLDCFELLLNTLESSPGVELIDRLSIPSSVRIKSFANNPLPLSHEDGAKRFEIGEG